MGAEQEFGGTDPDLCLVKALAGGDDIALDLLMARYEEPVFHFVYRLILNEADARDLTQETFVRLYFNIQKFKPKAKFSTWLYQIALNICRDHLKSKRSRQAAQTDSIFAQSSEGGTPWLDCISTSYPPTEEIFEKERMASIQAGIAALPPDLREAIVLTALEERSHQECAELLKTTPKAVETRVYRARKFLRAWLGSAGMLLLIFWNR